MNRNQLTDQNLLDMIDGAGYGIAYWATEATVDTEARTYTVHEGEIEPSGEGDGTGVHTIPFDTLKETYWKLVSLDQQYVNSEIHGYFLHSYLERDEGGVDAGWIDASAADVLVQVAAFGKVVFG